MENSKKYSLRFVLENYALYIIMALMIIIIGMMSPKFFSLRVLRDILTKTQPELLWQMGYVYSYLGSADLSGGRTVGLAQLSQDLWLKRLIIIKFWPSLPEMPVIVPLIAAILIGLLVGLANGFSVAKLKVPSFLATLGWMMVAYGANCLYSNKPPNNSQPLGGFLKSFTDLGTASFLSVPYIIYIAIGVCIVVHLL